MKYVLSESARIAMEDAYFYGATNWGDDQTAAYHLGLLSAFVELRHASGDARAHFLDT